MGGVKPSDVSYLECHGTGTSLGDPIEVGALHRVLRSTATCAEPIRIGVFKSLMAHSEGAAGMVGLVKVAHVLKQRCMPPNLHLQVANPKLALEAFAAAMPTQSTGSALSPELRMGVSSFGYSGTNSHAVLSSATELTTAVVGSRGTLEIISRPCGLS